MLYHYVIGLLYDACFIYVQCIYHTCIQNEIYIITIEKSVNISITRITRVNNICFLMLLLAMISLHMLTFRLMVTVVAEFCSLVILIHNTLLSVHPAIMEVSIMNIILSLNVKNCSTSGNASMKQQGNTIHNSTTYLTETKCVIYLKLATHLQLEK